MGKVAEARSSENRRNALRVHRLRFASRVFWTLAAIAATLTPTFAAAGNPLAKSLHGATMAALLMLSPRAPALAMPVLEGFTIFVLAIYALATDMSWEMEKSAFKQSELRATATGLMDAVDTMIGASYMSNLAAVFGVLAILTAPQPASLQDWPPLLQVALGATVCWLGFKIGHRYVAGPVLAPEMMIRTEMAGPEGVSRMAAANRVHGTKEALKAARPHHFPHTPRGRRK